MKIADLFVDLGVTGNEKSVGAIAGMRKGMGELNSVSIEAKAAIIGAMYALQRMFATSGQAGTNLTQFSQLVDTNTKTLQQYQWAAQQVGVSNQEMAGTFKTLQDAMTKALMGEGAPKGLARVAQLTQDFGEFDLLAYQKNPEKLIQRLQEYAQRETNTGLRNEALNGFGISDGVKAAMRQKAFRPDVLNRAPTYSDKEIANLAKADAAWANLGTTIEMAFGRFNAKHGGSLVENITKMVDEVVKLAEAFVKFAEKAKIFDHLTKVFDGWRMIFELISSTIDKVVNMENPKEALGEALLPSETAQAVGSAAAATGAVPTNSMDSMMHLVVRAMIMGQKLKSTDAADVMKSASGFLANFGTGAFAGRLHDAAFGDGPTSLRKVLTGHDKSLRPNVPALPAGATNTNSNTTVNQTLNFNGNGVDGRQAADAHKKAAKDAYQTSPARGWGN